MTIWKQYFDKVFVTTNKLLKCRNKASYITEEISEDIF